MSQTAKRQRVAYNFDGFLEAAVSLDWDNTMEMIGWPKDQPEMMPVLHNTVLSAIMAGGQPRRSCCEKLNGKSNPGQFASAQLELKGCKLLNYWTKESSSTHTGRCVSVGAKTPNAALNALLITRNDVYLSDQPDDGERFYFAKIPVVVNIVFSGRFPYAFDNAQIWAANHGIVTYVPSDFSGACVQPFPEDTGCTAKLFEEGPYTALGVRTLKRVVQLILFIIRMIAPFRVAKWQRKAKLNERVGEMVQAIAAVERMTREAEACSVPQDYY